MKNILISYIRDKKNNPRGVIVAVKRKDGSIGINYSFCRKSDKFSKEIGCRIAIGRASIDYQSPISCPREVYKRLGKFLARTEKYFKLKKHLIKNNFYPYAQT